ncbi:hypothetical protein Q5P01_012154 [Channa striata]|uniref:Uncharacterized protein n=1 Tax=Channa striata TaxID=64152 RepID=A0AA88MR66_CHASR|nr:hypothetical protein Q5P01_012154 [Channa striata]
MSTAAEVMVQPNKTDATVQQEGESKVQQTGMGPGLWDMLWSSTGGLRAFLPSFLPPDTEVWGSRWGVRMAGCAPIGRTDRLTRNRHADRRMPLPLLLLWTLFSPIRCNKESDIIPVLVGQQEGGGRR